LLFSSLFSATCRRIITPIEGATIVPTAESRVPSGKLAACNGSHFRTGAAARTPCFAPRWAELAGHGREARDTLLLLFEAGFGAFDRAKHCARFVDGFLVFACGNAAGHNAGAGVEMRASVRNNRCADGDG